MEKLIGKIAQKSHYVMVTCLPVNVSNLNLLITTNKPVYGLNVATNIDKINNESATLAATVSKHQQIFNRNINNPRLTQEMGSNIMSCIDNSHSGSEIDNNFDTYKESNEEDQERVNLDTLLQSSVNKYACM